MPMHLRMSESGFGSRDLSRDEHLSVAERELLVFIDTASELVGRDTRVHLREIWLDELACMHSMPEPSSPDWRLVTEAALRRLGLRQLEIHGSQLRSWNPKDAKRNQ